MNTESQISKELDELNVEVTELFKLTEKTNDIVTFGTRYQVWYSRAFKIVELLGPERLDEFCSYYRIDPKRKVFDVSTYVIQDYITGIGASGDYMHKPLWDIQGAIYVKLLNQSQILGSLKSRLGTILSDVKGHIRAEIEDEELEIAQKLVVVSHRGAGAIAGVVLEGHLQRVALNHKIKISKKNPTIVDLNDPLKSAGIYDIPIWRKIQHLSDIRNLCDHKKEREPKIEEVEELIAGIASIIKTVF